MLSESLLCICGKTGNNSVHTLVINYCSSLDTSIIIMYVTYMAHLTTGSGGYLRTAEWLYIGFVFSVFRTSSTVRTYYINVTVLRFCSFEEWLDFMYSVYRISNGQLHWCQKDLTVLLEVIKLINESVMGFQSIECCIQCL